VPLLLSFGVGLLVTAGVTLFVFFQPPWAALDDLLSFLAMNIIAYSALGWCYFHFVNLCISSLRIRVLEEIIDAGGALPTADLGALYDNRKMTAVRIERLTSSGHLVSHDARFYSGKQGFLIVARIFKLLRWFIIGDALTESYERSAG